MYKTDHHVDKHTQTNKAGLGERAGKTPVRLFNSALPTPHLNFACKLQTKNNISVITRYCHSFHSLVMIWTNHY